MSAVTRVVDGSQPDEDANRQNSGSFWSMYEEYEEDEEESSSSSNAADEFEEEAEDDTAEQRNTIVVPKGTKFYHTSRRGRKANLEPSTSLFCLLDPVAWSMNEKKETGKPTHEITTTRKLRLYLGLEGFTHLGSPVGCMARLTGAISEIEAKTLRLSVAKEALVGLDGWLSAVEERSQLEVCLFDPTSYLAVPYVAPPPWRPKIVSPLSCATFWLNHDTVALGAEQTPANFRALRLLWSPHKYRGGMPDCAPTAESCYGDDASAWVAVRNTGE